MPDLLGSRHNGLILAGDEADGFAWQYIRPGSLSDLQNLVSEAVRLGYGIAPGPPVKLPDRLRGKAIIFVDLSAVNNIVEHWRADQVISVEAGLTVAALNQWLSEYRQWWPVAGNTDMTVAEAINCGDGGCLEHGFGGPRDLVLGLSAVLAGGRMINCGGRVVKNVSGYDLQKLFIQSRGCLGVVGKAYLRLYAKPESSVSLLGFAAGFDQAIAVARDLIKSGFPLSCLELVDTRLVRAVVEKGLKADLKLLAGRRLSHRDCPPSAILIQIHGTRDVVNETRKAIEAKVSIHSWKEIALELEDAFWRCLSGVSGPETLEVSCDMGEMAALVEYCRQDDKSTMYQARPGRGRLKLHAGARAIPLARSVERWASGRKSGLSLAYGDQEYSFRVKRFPQDRLLDTVSQRIKARYDPSLCMNPLVALY